MSRILAVSPHLDDAVFSAGGALSAHARAGDEVIVLTCFTGNVAQPTGFALACQLDKGLDPGIDYMALRRGEDERACAAIGARAVHWPYLEAPHRGYDSAAALFGDRIEDDDAADRLAPELARIIREIEPNRVYGPCGVGDHVDHLAVREALEQVSQAVTWWEDFPYAMQSAEPPPGIVRHRLDPADAARKLAAVLCYESQLGFQFGSREEARTTLERWGEEGIARR